MFYSVERGIRSGVKESGCSKGGIKNRRFSPTKDSPIESSSYRVAAKTQCQVLVLGWRRIGRASRQSLHLVLQ